MKYLLLIPIKIYWALIPASKRNSCLFKVSCSNYVYNLTAEKGILKGLKAFLHRYKNCRPGYYMMDIENETYMITTNHEMFHSGELRDSISN